MAFNNFSGVPAGTQLTTGNSGGAGNTVLDTAVSGTDAAMLGSTDFTIHGNARSLKVTTGATSSTNLTGWNASTLGAGSDTMYTQGYYYFPSLPSANVNIARFTQGGTSTLCGTLIVLTSGLVRFTSGGTMTTTTVAVPTNAWVRIQSKLYSHATAGWGEIKIFKDADLEGTTATETVTSAASFATGPGTIDTIRFPQTGALSNFGPMYLSDMDVRTTGYADAIGGSTPTWVTSKFARFG
jgi:hypothetical protein